MVRAGPVLLLLLLAACSTPEDSGSAGEPASPEPRELRVERIAAGSPGQGVQRPQVVISRSAEALSRDIDAEIPASGKGTYLVAHMGEQPTGGYSVNVGGAKVEGDRATVTFSLKGPPADAIVTQVLTYPYVIAFVEDLDPAGKEFRFVDGAGERLDWPVRRVGG